jgi:hypothetical protein
MACEPSQLLEDAKCIMWCVPRGANGAIIVSLWCQILDNGFSGDTFYILAETGDILNAENADKLRQE